MSLGAIVARFSPLYTEEELVELVKMTDIHTFLTFDAMLETVKYCYQRAA